MAAFLREGRFFAPFLLPFCVLIFRFIYKV
ncbi:MAG: hypothetical protein JWQ24_5025 [Tardiphaga sp.]|nr:hypothetical protein [Tardiphaga sp.]